MKKLLLVLLCATLLIFSTVVVASAEKPGDKVTVTVTIASNSSDAYATSYQLNFNTDVFSGNSTGVFVSIPNGVQNVGKSATHEFTIKEGAPAGTYSITVTPISARDASKNEVGGVTYSISGGNITIEGSSSPEECTHATTSTKETKKATCTAAGEKQTVCNKCGEVLKTEAIPALGHDDGKWEETKAATCTEKGSKTLKCTRCSEALKTEEIPALGHDDGKWVVVTPATSETEGLRQLQCTRCGEVLGEEVLPVVTSEWLSVSVCSLGFRYRDVKPELTDKWYMFTPLDLSQNGETVFDLIGGNCTKVGRVTVNVNDGKATMSYFVFGGVDVADMGFALLPNLDSVTDVDAIDYSRFAFDEEISIADALEGDTHVLLQVMGHITYDFQDPRCPRFYCTGKDYQDFLDSRRPFMD